MSGAHDLVRRLRNQIASWSRPAQGPGDPRHLLFGLVLPVVIATVNMWEVQRFTIDDAYISYRYARNLVDGYGLVYNPGERVEGYTNLLWTLLVAGGLKLGIDPHPLTKVLGGLSMWAVLAGTYVLSNRLCRFVTLPCVATWLLATTIAMTGYAVFGLESAFFAALVLWGTIALFAEERRGHGFPWSGVLFAIAGLCRPEAPMYLGIPMLALGRGFFSRRNILRGVVFVTPLLIQIMWRHSYYGEWLPSTFTAKTGDIDQQYEGGTRYIRNYVDYAGAVVFFALYGFTLGVVRRQAELITVGTLTGASLAYVVIVGGDWMPEFRFMTLVEPFWYVLVCVGVRALFDRRDPAAMMALALFAAFTVRHRSKRLDEAQKHIIKEEKRFWDNASGQTARWLVEHGKPGKVAIGDIGYVGYKTNFPVLDLLGLVDPVIRELPGGYTRKLGKPFVDHFYATSPRWLVLILSGQKCDNPKMTGSIQLYTDPRFAKNYVLRHNVQVAADASWCIFEHK